MKTKDYKKLDSLLHDIVVARDGKCQMCGRGGTLQASHIYSKAAIHHQNMRWIPENVVAMCMHCHLHKWHKEIIGSYEWYVANIDETRRMELAVEAMKPSVLPLDGDYEKIREWLIDYFNEMKTVSNT